jgi:hypothetical protein
MFFFQGQMDPGGGIRQGGAATWFYQGKFGQKTVKENF